MIVLNGLYYNEKLIVKAYSADSKYYADFFNGIRVTIPQAEYNVVIIGFTEIGNTHYNLAYVTRAGIEGTKKYLDFPKGVRIYVTDSVYNTAITLLKKVNSTYYKEEDILSAKRKDSEHFVTFENGITAKVGVRDFRKISDYLIEDDNYIFNTTPTLTTLTNLSLNFTSNSTNYTKITVTTTAIKYGTTTVYDTTNGWANTAYKTIKLGELAGTENEDLLDWVVNNTERA